MSLLAWRPGERSDRSRHFRTFQCTPDPTKRRRPWGGYEETHDAPYERPVQALIRHSLAPVGDPDRTVLLGLDAAGKLGALTTYRSLGEAQFELDIVAVALAYRHRGGGWASEALRTTLDYMTADADGLGYDSIDVAARIHEDNRPSQRLFISEEFDQTDVLPDGYQVWSGEIRIAL